MEALTTRTLPRGRQRRRPAPTWSLRWALGAAGRKGLGSSEGGQWVKPCFSQDGQWIQPPQTLLSPGGLRNGGELRPQSGPPLLASLTSSMNNNKDDFSQPVCRIMNTQRGKEAFLGPHSPSFFFFF